MSVNAAYWLAAAAFTTSAYQGEQSRKAQSRGATQAKETAKRAESQQTRETNRANARAPNVGALLDRNQQAAAAGGSGTLLTGPQGIDPNLLTLGKTTLLGGGG